MDLTSKELFWVRCWFATKLGCDFDVVDDRMVIVALR